MGIHPLDLLIILLVCLALFGPKALQSIASNAGKGVGQMKTMKDKVLSELPVEEVTKISEQIPQVPLDSRQAVQMLLSSAPDADTKGPKTSEAQSQK
jgi:TatA/E family protein of Tat protein translocase